MASKKSGEANAIVVGIRVRPFNQREIKYNSSCIISMDGNCTRVHETNNGKPVMAKPREFVFDYAFWTHDKDGSGAPAPAAGTAPAAPPPFADQKYVYDRLGVQIVENVFQGFNACLFAYGQTGSGKTYSMMGTATDPGMLPRIGTDVFERAEMIMMAGNECTVKASFCELYNEKCRDLLASPEVGKDGKPTGKESGELKIRMHPQTGVFVEGITSYTLKSPEEYFKLLERGLSHRTTASTNMNATSSRSHGIVLLTVFQKDTNGSKTGKMSLVDLAGSERMAATGATGATAVEGQNINRSLTTLGMVLSKLADKATSGDKGGAAHIPYRDSQLTFLLMDNLGGNSKTSMIAAVSPASVNYDETMSTLRFSSVAKKVKSVATVNEDPNDKLIRELKTELGELRDRLKRLQEAKKAKNAANTPGGAPTPSIGTPTTADVPNAPPPTGELIEATAFPSSTPEPTPDASGAASRIPTPPPEVASPPTVTAVADGSGAAVMTVSTAEVPEEPQSPSDGLGAESPTTRIKAQIEQDEGALASLQATPLEGQRLLQDNEVTRVHLTRTPSVLVGSINAPNPILVHAANHTSRSVTMPPSGASSNCHTHSNALSPAPPVAGAPFAGDGSTANSTVVLPGGADSLNIPLAAADSIVVAADSLVLGAADSIVVKRRGGDAADTFGALLAAADSVVVEGGIQFDDSIVVPARHGAGAEGNALLLADSIVVEGADNTDRRRRGAPIADDNYAEDSNDENDEDNAAMLAAADREDDEGFDDDDASDEDGDPTSPKREVMVDWRAPQLINLRPEAGGDVLIIPLSEGQTDCEMDDVNVYFNYDALAVVVTVFSDTSGAVCLNGIPIEDEGTVLRHNDRIVVGENAFRFVFPLQDGQDFKTNAVSVDHLLLLEKYERMKIVEERAKNAMNIGKAYFTMLSEISGSGVKAPTINLTPRGATGMTPRSSNLLLASIGDDSSHTNQLVYELEKQLAEEFPADAEDLEETHLNVEDLAEYTEAIDEKARMLQQQQDEVNALRDLLERQNKLASASIASPLRAEASEVAVVQESINAACSEAVLQRELVWHKQVKSLKNFKSSGGPTDPVDNLMWRRLSSDPPFACDALLKLERTLTTPVSDPKTKEGGSRKWTNRFIACSRQFVFIFRQTNDVQPCLGAVYLPGAQITAPTDRASRMGDGVDADAPQYFVEIAPAVARSLADHSVSSHQCSVRIGFDDDVTMLSWRQYFEECAAPQMPLSMLKRWTKEFVASHGTISVYADPCNGLATRRDMMPAKMKWKPDNSVDACEDCRKPFKLLIRGKHHCRGCGGIFCADCLAGKGEEKKCENCRLTYHRQNRGTTAPGAGGRAGAAVGALQPCRRTNILSEFELKRPHLLRETFPVRIEIVNNPSNAETVRRLAVPAEAISAAKASGVVTFGSFDDDGIVQFQIDHYRGRAHTFTGDEILRLERSLLIPTVLTLHTIDNAVLKLSFEDAMSRERCVESLFVLMGCRVYMPGLRDVVETSNVVVTNEVGEDCFFRMTNNIAVDARLWVGIEDGRTIPFHENYAVWSFVGHKETWNEQTLKSYRLCLLEQAQLSRDTYLYVVCTLEWRQNIMAVTACPVSRSPRYTVGAIGLRMLESTVLFVGVHQAAIVYNDFVDAHGGGSKGADHLFNLGHISTTNLPVVDALQQYDHAFLINSPGLPQFLQANPVVHYSSPNVEVMLAGRSAVELVVPCVGFSCSKFCDRPSQRPVFKLLAATILETKAPDELPIERVPKGDIVSQCQLWCSMGFDRLYEGQVVTDPTRLHGMASNEAKSAAYNEVMLVSSMAEYCSLGKLFVVCADMGSVAINIAQVMAPMTSSPAAAPTVTDIVCEVYRGGKVIAIADIKLSSRWEFGYTGVDSFSSISALEKH